MDKMRELEFFNVDATPKKVVLHVSASSVSPIMDWYGSHFAGDRYSVFLDGEKLYKDKNGALIGEVE